MLYNFLCIDTAKLNTLDYFKFVIQFDEPLQADLWFIENDINTDDTPFYKDTLEYTPFNIGYVSPLKFCLNKLNINTIKMIEADYFRVLCFTDKQAQEFIAERIQGAAESETLEVTDVDADFIYGFANQTQGLST